MIAVRAATAPYAITDLPDPGRAAFSEIADEARTALTELRVVLGVLRAPEGGSETAPQPRLADLDGLLSRMTRAGMDVTMTVTGLPGALPASVELCCYRIVQEALTNAGRHAPGSTIRVQLGYQSNAVSVRVRNCRGGPPSGPGRTGQPAGYGLTGLRERVETLRGEFQAGPDGRGGVSVTAPPPPGPAGAGAAAGGGPRGGPPPGVLVLTTFDLDDYVYDALRAGASGFLLKDATPDEILHAVRIIGGGEALLAPGVTRRLIAEFATHSRPVPSPALGRLTPREHEVLLLVAGGLTNAEIAARLCLASQTVKSHVSSVLFKLELRDRVQAVLLYYVSGMVFPGDPGVQSLLGRGDGARPGPW